MTILIDNRCNFILTEEIEALINKVALKALETENFSTNCEISISFVSLEEIQKINKQYRNIDKATDVLSFPQLFFEKDEEYMLNENQEILLGDIIISIEKAEEQAKDYGHSFTREICFLTAHSMLHLLGYDHMDDEEEELMIGKQKDLLNSLNIVR